VPQPAASGFALLGISPQLVMALAAGGITEPFPVQSLTIPDALSGRDICGKARTGSGKTLAFGLPLIERIGKSQPRMPRAVVLVPTRELAAQVVAELAPLAAVKRVRVAAVYGGMSLNRQADRLRAGVDIVVATPGRLHDLMQRNAVSLDDVTSVVIDEADQMADLGFLPQVERILSQVPGRHQTLLFSATLDGAVDQLVKRYQTDPVYHEVQTEPENIPTMLHRFIAVPEADKVRVAADIASGPGRTLLFVRTQRGAERLVRMLDEEGLAAGAIHGGLSQPKRERALAAFARGSMPVLVATNIAARGIHVDGVDIVVHHDPPEDTKTYLHRSGRTARAGASGLVVTLVSPEQARDVNVLRREAGVREAVVPMAPGDERLRDLAGWEPPLDDHTQRQEPAMGARPHARPWHGNREQSVGQPRRTNRAYAGRGPAPHARPQAERRPDHLSDSDFRPSGPRNGGGFRGRTPGAPAGR
jgi:superfamily II DNA/RNA helicase